MAKFSSRFLSPYSVATICAIIGNTRHEIHLSPNKLESLSFASQNHITHRDNSNPLQPQRESKFHLDKKTIRQITSGSISGFGVGLLISVISRPLLIITVFMGFAIQIVAYTGTNLISYQSLQRYINIIKRRNIFRVNRAWGSSFCVTFLIAGFFKFD